MLSKLYNSNSTGAFVLLVVGLVAIVVLVGGGMMYGTKWFNAKTVQHQIITPKPGIECVVVTSTDGASTDCWKVDVSQ